MKDVPRLAGKTLFLRALCVEDADGNYPNWLNDPEVTKFNSHGERVYTKEMALVYIDMVSKSPFHQVFAIIESSSLQHIGNISLQNIDIKAKNAEFAILLGEPSIYGKGVGEEAARLVFQHGFSTLELHRIYCGTSSKNLAMQRLALKLGMQQEGIRRDAFIKNGEYADIIEYGILENEYQNNYNDT